MSYYDWNSENRQVLLEGNESLNRATQSIARSQQVALETEQVGVEVVSELNEQRETLLRTKQHLSSADDELDKSKVLIQRLTRNVFCNKLILIAIICLEVVILTIETYLKFFHKKT